MKCLIIVCSSANFWRLQLGCQYSLPSSEIHYLKIAKQVVRNSFLFLSVLCSEFSCQIRRQLWEQSSLICIHVREAMLSVLTICREYCLQSPTVGSNLSRMLQICFFSCNWSEASMSSPCSSVSSVATNFTVRPNSHPSSLEIPYRHKDTQG